MIGEGFREWLKPLLMKKGLGLMEKPRVYPRKKKGMLVTPQPWLQKPPPRGHVGLILIQVIPVPRILRLSPRGVPTTGVTPCGV